MPGVGEAPVPPTRNDDASRADDTFDLHALQGDEAPLPMEEKVADGPLPD